MLEFRVVSSMFIHVLGYQSLPLRVTMFKKEKKQLLFFEAIRDDIAKD